MFQAGVGSAKGKGNSSDSESDWDTTVDFPTPRHTAGNDTALESGGEDSKALPTPRIRTARSDKAGEATPRSARREGGTPLSARKDNRAPASAAGVHLSAVDTGSRNPSPIPPYTAGFRDALKNGDDSSSRGRQPSPVPMGKDRKGNRYYEPSPTPRVPATIDAAAPPPIPKWDDSDAEQQTLQELHTTFKKEKTREIESEAARKQVQDDGDRSSAAGRNTSTLEKWMQGREDRRLKSAQEVNQQAVVSQGRKAGVSNLPAHWSDRGNFNENAVPAGVDAPYQSLVVKDPDGKRFLYFFSEGSTAFYEVEEEESEAVMPKVAEKVEGYIQRAWQEFFGALRILTSIVIFLVVEALNYVTNHVARPLFLGVVIMTGNRLVKPVLAGLFNLILQPFVIFSWNFVSGVRHVCQPLIDILGGVTSKLAILLQAFRLVEVNLGDEYLQNRRGVSAGRGARHDSEVV